MYKLYIWEMHQCIPCIECIECIGSIPLNPLAGVETNVYCFTGLLVRYLCGCCLAVFVLMTSTLSLALHPTFYDQCTIVGTNPRATAVKTNPQAN